MSQITALHRDVLRSFVLLFLSLSSAQHLRQHLNAPPPSPSPPYPPSPPLPPADLAPLPQFTRASRESRVSPPPSSPPWAQTPAGKREEGRGWLLQQKLRAYIRQGIGVLGSGNPLAVRHRFLSYPHGTGVNYHQRQPLFSSQVCIRLPFTRPASLAPLVLQEAWAALSRHWPTSSTTRTTKRRHSHSRQSKPSQLTIRARIPTTTTPWPYALPASCRGSFATSARRT